MQIEGVVARFLRGLLTCRTVGGLGGIVCVGVGVSREKDRNDIEEAAPSCSWDSNQVGWVQLPFTV